MSRKYRNHSDDVIGWWAQTIIRGYDPMCPMCKEIESRCDFCSRGVTEEINNGVLAEWERRGKPKPKISQPRKS